MKSAADVIKAIKVCRNDDMCRQCPYFDIKKCNVALMDDVLEILRSTEPKVMTAVEFEKTPRWECVFIEFRGKSKIEYIQKISENNLYAIFERSSYLMQLSKSDYGKQWRCWTRNPSVMDRQRYKWHGKQKN